MKVGSKIKIVNHVFIYFYTIYNSLMSSKFLLYCSVVIFLFSCTPAKKIQVNKPLSKPVKIESPESPVKELNNDVFIEQLLKRYPNYFDSIINNKDVYNVQIIYTQINRKENNYPVLTTHTFNVNRKKYFYPASTVKLPTALLALQRINELKEKGVNKNTTMITEAGYSGQTPVYNDPLSPNGKPTVAGYIKKILLVSDNDAFNRLYEFLGPGYINKELHNMGYSDVQLIHRLQIFLTPDENRHTNPVKFLDSNNTIIHSQPLVYDSSHYSGRNDSLGKAYFSNGKQISGPMDFSKKNRIALEDLHNILRSLIFPSTVPSKQRFNLTQEDYNFIYKYMSSYPGESIYPMYDTSIYYDSYAKLLLYGSQKSTISNSVRIFNKEGDAYGHLTDVAYIIDPVKNVEFFLSATIYCNSKGIINYDDTYDYEKIGYPFMKNLGKIFYEYETNRRKKVKPDLVGFKILYDK